MDEEQFEAMMAQLVSRLDKLIENTKPDSRFKRLVDSVVAIITICGGITVIDQLIKWVRG